MTLQTKSGRLWWAGLGSGFVVLLAVGIGLTVGVQKVYAANCGGAVDSCVPNGPTLNYLRTPAYRNKIQSDPVTADSACQSSLATTPGSGRPKVSNSIPYRELAWITSAGSPSTGVTVAANDASPIPLQLNYMQFICAVLTQNPPSNPDVDYVPNPAQQVLTGANYPANRGVYMEGDSFGHAVNDASRFELRMRIAGASVTAGAGSLNSVDVGQVLTLSDLTGSRYWLGDSVENFNYVPPAGGFSASTNVTITFDVQYFRTYHAKITGGNASTCVDPANPKNSLSFNSVRSQASIPWGLCANTTIAISVPINVIQASCTGISYSTPPKAGQPFNLTSKVSYSPGVAPSPSMSLSITGPPDYGPVATTPTQSGATLTGTFSNITLGYGNYDATVVFTSGGTTVSCPSSFKIGIQPYFSVVGGDIAAGANYASAGTACTSAGDVSIKGINSGSPGYTGAGGEMAAWLGGSGAGKVQNFVSGLGLAGAPSASTATALSFAHATAGNYGIAFKSPLCNPDFFSTRSGPTWGGETTGTFGASGNVTIPAMTLGPDQQLTLYVSGNAYVNGDIDYIYNAATTPPASIPRFNLYVDGNLVINKDVRTLRGVYAVQKIGPSAGNIATCGIAAGDPATSPITLSYTDCKKPLTVYGSMNAEGTLYLNRTYGSVFGAGTVPSAPAETFVYSPQMWLSGQGSLGQVQSYTSLAPVL